MAQTKKTQKAVSAPRSAAPSRARKRTLPTETDIASRAYELFVRRGGEHGRDVDDWLLAQRELSPDH